MSKEIDYHNVDDLFDAIAKTSTENAESVKIVRNALIDLQEYGFENVIDWNEVIDNMQIWFCEVFGDEAPDEFKQHVAELKEELKKAWEKCEREANARKLKFANENGFATFEEYLNDKRLKKANENGFATYEEYIESEYTDLPF